MKRQTLFLTRSEFRLLPNARSVIFTVRVGKSFKILVTSLGQGLSQLCCDSPLCFGWITLRAPDILGESPSLTFWVLALWRHSCRTVAPLWSVHLGRIRTICGVLRLGSEQSSSVWTKQSPCSRSKPAKACGARAWRLGATFRR